MNPHPNPPLLELDALEIVVVVDNETDTLSSIDPGLPQAPEVADLALRTPTSREYQRYACKCVFDQLCCAGHGYSLLLTAERRGVRSCDSTRLGDAGRPRNPITTGSRNAVQQLTRGLTAHARTASIS